MLLQDTTHKFWTISELSNIVKHYSDITYDNCYEYCNHNKANADTKGVHYKLDNNTNLRLDERVFLKKYNGKLDSIIQLFLPNKSMCTVQRLYDEAKETIDNSPTSVNPSNNSL